MYIITICAYFIIRQWVCHIRGVKSVWFVVSDGQAAGRIECSSTVCYHRHHLLPGSNANRVCLKRSHGQYSTANIGRNGERLFVLLTLIQGLVIYSQRNGEFLFNSPRVSRSISLRFNDFNFIFETLVDPF